MNDNDNEYCSSEMEQECRSNTENNQDPENRRKDPAEVIVKMSVLRDTERRIQ